MIHQLRRHPIEIAAFFRHSLVLTYAFPRDLLLPLLPPGLILDELGNFGFLAVALVQTKSLRPAILPAALGADFFLAGYRIFVRFKTSGGRTVRGLRILRSDTDSRSMVLFGNMLTHYGYRRAGVVLQEKADELNIKIVSSDGSADLHVIARIDQPAAELPSGSPFNDLHQARLFAGPLPYTFDYEAETHSIIMIEGVRQTWKPQPVHVEVLQNTFLEQAPFCQARPILANAFHVRDVDYRWRRGMREPLPRAS
jgi:hypothetical protein